MRAGRFHGVGKGLRVDDIPPPEPGPGEVRVAVRACGVCGSDVHIVHGSTATGPVPLVLGHEAAGVVDAVGPEVADREADGAHGVASADGASVPGAGVAPGARVAVAAGYGCGECRFCAVGEENRCPRLVIPGIDRDGAQAEYVVVPARSVVPLPDGVDFSTGAICTDAVATPYRAVRRSGVRPGDVAVVYGLGGLGLHAASILAQVFGAHVIGVDTHPAALERARAFGVHEVVDAGEGRPSRRVRELTDGGADVSFEFVGAAAVVDQAVKSLRPGGTCTVVGVGPEPLQLVRQDLLVAAELRVQGSFGSTRAELVELLELVAAGRLDLTGTITHRFPLEDFPAAVDVLVTRSGDPIRVVVEQPAPR